MEKREAYHLKEDTDMGREDPQEDLRVLFVSRRRNPFRNIILGTCSQRWNVLTCIYVLKGHVRKDLEISNRRLTIGVTV